MALPDLTGQNIQNTYQRILQVSSSGQVTDGTGSLVPLLEITASFAVSASHEITTEVSSSHAESADTLGGLTTTVAELNYLDGITSAQGDFLLETNQTTATTSNVVFSVITSSGNISSSGTIFTDTLSEGNSTTGLTLTGNITSSGNISSSGNIYSNNHEVLASTSFKIVDLDDGKYGMPGNTGVGSPTWGFQFTDGGDGLGASSQHVGFTLPYKSVLIGVIGAFRAGATGNYKFALWTEDEIEDGDTDSETDWVNSLETADISCGTTSRFTNFEKLDGTSEHPKGTQILPTFYNGTGTDNSDIFGNYTIVIKRIK